MNENANALITYVKWAKEHGLVTGYLSTLQAYLKVTAQNDGLEVQ